MLGVIGERRFEGEYIGGELPCRHISEVRSDRVVANVTRELSIHRAHLI